MYLKWNHKFLIIALSESWLKDYNCDRYGKDDYNIEHNCRPNQEGGVVSLDVKDTIEYTVRDDLWIISQTYLSFTLIRIFFCILSLLDKITTEMFILELWDFQGSAICTWNRWWHFDWVCSIKIQHNRYQFHDDTVSLFM